MPNPLAVLTAGQRGYRIHSMERREYLALREKIVARYERETARYERDLEALERVWAIANEDNESALTSEAVHEVAEQVEPSPEEQVRTLAPSQGSPAVQDGQNGTLRRWSLRKEIERLLPEFGADEDIYSGKVRPM